MVPVPVRFRDSIKYVKQIIKGSCNFVSFKKVLGKIAVENVDTYCTIKFGRIQDL